MKKRKIVSLVLSLCMVLGLMLLPMQAAQATDANVTNEAILDARKGILEVTQVVTVDGQMIGYSRGTGFLVGGDDGAQTVITNHHVVNAFPYDEKTLRKAIEEGIGGALASDVKVKAEIRIVVKRDVYITAEIVNQSEAGDFAILKLEQPIYDREPLTFADSSTVTSTQQVYALGFPAAVEGAWGEAIGESIQLDAIYTADDVTVTNGIVSKISENIGTGAPISTIVHSATISGGNSGGPLMTAEGYVVGINTYHMTAENNTAAGYNYSTEINEVSDVLTALGIEYKRIDPEPTPAPDPIKETTEEPDSTETSAPIETENPKLADLEDAISDAEKVSLENMSEDSAANFNAALKAAKAVLSDGAASDEDIDTAIDNLETAKTGLVEEKGLNTTLIIIIAAVAVVIIVVVVIIIVVSSGKKKKKKAEAEKAAEMQRQQQQRQQQQRQQAGGGQQWNQQQRQQAGGGQQWNQQQRQQQSFNSQSSAFAGNDGSGETSVLNDGAGETTVLGGGQSIPGAVLIRRKNNERVTITKAVFKIGKERRKVDYCISDNTNISRSHADIVCKNGEFFIIDKNATNGTSVNGTAVAGGQERKLNNNDIVRLADEEFQFKML